MQKIFLFFLLINVNISLFSGDFNQAPLSQEAFTRLMRLHHPNIFNIITIVSTEVNNNIIMPDRARGINIKTPEYQESIATIIHIEVQRRLLQDRHIINRNAHIVSHINR